MPDLGLPKHANQRLTAKQEDFCRKFMELRSASEAYRAAYDAENMKRETVHRNASALLSNSKVATRLDELRAEQEIFVPITLDEVAGGLRQAWKVAVEQGHSGHMSLAANSLAKLGGLIVDQQKIENVDANEAHLEALRELAAAPVMPPAPAPTPDPVVPPAAKPPHILDITPESDDAVRH
jgi:hypothetical protein